MDIKDIPLDQLFICFKEDLSLLSQGGNAGADILALMSSLKETQQELARRYEAALDQGVEIANKK